MIIIKFYPTTSTIQFQDKEGAKLKEIVINQVKKPRAEDSEDMSNDSNPPKDNFTSIEIDETIESEETTKDEISTEPSGGSVAIAAYAHNSCPCSCREFEADLEGIKLDIVILQSHVNASDRATRNCESLLNSTVSKAVHLQEIGEWKQKTFELEQRAVRAESERDSLRLALQLIIQDMKTPYSKADGPVDSNCGFQCVNRKMGSRLSKDRNMDISPPKIDLTNRYSCLSTVDKNLELFQQSSKPQSTNRAERLFQQQRPSRPVNDQRQSDSDIPMVLRNSSNSVTLTPQRLNHNESDVPRERKSELDFPTCHIDCSDQHSTDLNTNGIQNDHDQQASVHSELNSGFVSGNSASNLNNEVVQDGYVDRSQPNDNNKEKRPRHLPRPKVLILGDSMLKRIRLSKVRQSSTNKSIFIRSFPGATTTDMFDYCKPSIRNRPDHLILHIGTNDLRSKEADSVIHNISCLGEEIKKYSPDTSISLSEVIVRKDSSSVSAKVHEVNKQLLVLCQARGWSLITHNNIDENGLDRFGIHLNNQGNATLARNLINHIQYL